MVRSRSTIASSELWTIELRTPRCVDRNNYECRRITNKLRAFHTESRRRRNSNWNNKTNSYRQALVVLHANCNIRKHFEWIKPFPLHFLWIVCFIIIFAFRFVVFTVGCSSAYSHYTLSKVNVAKWVPTAVARNSPKMALDDKRCTKPKAESDEREEKKKTWDLPLAEFGQRSECLEHMFQSMYVRWNRVDSWAV